MRQVKYAVEDCTGRILVIIRSMTPIHSGAAPAESERVKGASLVQSIFNPNGLMVACEPLH